MKSSPPEWIDRVVEWYCADYYVEEVLGDLHEWYLHRQQENPRSSYLQLRYLVSVIGYFTISRSKPFHRLINSPKYLAMNMILKITFRNLFKEKLSGIVRLVNLVLGISFFLLCLIYTRYELAYDEFHTNSENIYRIGSSFDNSPWAAQPIGLGPWMWDNVSSVKRMNRFVPVRTTSMKFGDQIFYEESGVMADSTVFDMFSYELIQGNPKTALLEPFSIILTERLARKYFGDENPMGKLVELSFDTSSRTWENTPRKVTGVMKDVPAQSHLQFDFICSPYTFSDEWLRAWRNFWVYTYIEFEPGADLDHASALAKEEFMRQYGVVEDEGHGFEMVLTPIERIHLYTNHEKEIAHNGNIYNVYILFCMGALVLVISCINFINLTVIRGFDRAKEIGLRKVVGASRHQLIWQFLAENAVILVMAGIVSIGILALLTPAFRTFTGLDLPLNVFRDPSVLGTLLLILLGLQVASGIYPALVLSGISPSQSIKSATVVTPAGSIGLTRRVLIVMQFSLSFILVIGSIVVFRQLTFIQEKELGFEKDQVALIHINKETGRHYEAFEQAIIDHPGIKSISTASDVPGYRISLEGLQKMGIDTEHSTRLIYADHAFIDTYGIRLLEGKPFNKQFAPANREFYVNEQAVQEFFDDGDVLGQRLVVSGDTGTVVGIVQDFNFQSLHSPIEPLTIYNIPWAMTGGYASIKFESAQVKSVLEAIETAGNEIYPNLPALEVVFLDERFAQLYVAESQLRTVILIFCIVTILLTVSGLIGVASYNVRKREKEIAVRKVLGCSTTELVAILSRSFLLLLGISLAIGLPGAYYLTQWWLEDFAYRVPVQPGIFVLSALIMVFIILNSSGLITLRAARSNPAKTLKNE